jgi:plastocyanin
MHSRFRFSLAFMLLALFVPALLASARSEGVSGSVTLAATPTSGHSHDDPDSHKGRGAQSENPLFVPQPGHLAHPCSGMSSEPPFQGLSPLAIAFVPGMCNDGYGDIGVWQANGHDYVVLSGFALRMFHIFNVDDPYNPVAVRTQLFPSGGDTSTSVFAFRQGSNHYVSVTMRGSGTGCGFFVYNVNNPANPVFVARKSGADWCTPHEHFVSTDSNGDADYAWLAMSGDSGSGSKAVVLDIRNLPTITETGRYQRPDANDFSIFVHDITVIGNRVYLAHWDGGLIIHDKETLAHNINPTPLNPINSIRPSSFSVHHSWPTTDGNHVFIEDEITNSPALEKVKMYNISNLSAPFYETGIIGTGTAASNDAHNLKILSQSPGHDLLFVAWYEAGTRGFQVDTTGPSPVITATISHQLRQSTTGNENNAWGVDFLPCTLRGQSRTCVYTGDLVYGLVSDTLDYDPALDPYKPEAQITDPTNNQFINTCTYTIRGTAHDYYSGLAQVEVSVDDGVTWQPAQGTTNWTYTWNIPYKGPYHLRSRATDMAGNVEVPTAVVNVSVTTFCLATPSATSATAATATGTASSTVTRTATRTSTTTPVTTPVTTPTATPTCPPLVDFRDVIIRDYEYWPQQNITVTAGTTVRWLNDGPSGHTTTSDTGVWDSGTLNPGQTYQYESGTPGTYPYHCTLHPGMVGSITVLAGCVPTITPTRTPTRTSTPTGIATSATPTRTGTQTLMLTATSTSTRTNTAVVPLDTWVPTSTATQTAAVTATFTPCPITFTDVDPDNTFYTWIRCLACRGIVSGYGDGTFRPFGEVTRGQIAKIVSNAAGIEDEPGPQLFEDVDSKNPFYTWINRLSNLGYMGGYLCGGEGEPCGSDNWPYFRPFSNATRGQLAKIVSNAAGIGGTPTGQFYADVLEDNPFYVWIMRLTDLGVMSGYPCGGEGEPCDGENRPYFRPYNNVTRGQAAKIVANTFLPGCQTPAR